MTFDLAAVITALVGLLTAIGAYVKVTYAKPKAMADAETQRLANAWTSVTNLQAAMTTQQQQHQQDMAHMRAEMAVVRSHYGNTQTQLDVTRDRLAMVEQQNYEWAQWYHRDMIPAWTRQAEVLRAANLPVPGPPDAPHPRMEFTRRSDFPTRAQFEAAGHVPPEPAGPPYRRQGDALDTNGQVDGSDE